MAILSLLLVSIKQTKIIIILLHINKNPLLLLSIVMDPTLIDKEDIQLLLAKYDTFLFDLDGVCVALLLFFTYFVFVFFLPCANCLGYLVWRQTNS